MKFNSVEFYNFVKENVNNDFLVKSKIIELGHHYIVGSFYNNYKNCDEDIIQDVHVKLLQNDTIVEKLSKTKDIHHLIFFLFRFYKLRYIDVYRTTHCTRKKREGLPPLCQRVKFCSLDEDMLEGKESVEIETVDTNDNAKYIYNQFKEIILENLKTFKIKKYEIRKGLTTKEEIADFLLKNFMLEAEGYTVFGRSSMFNMTYSSLSIILKNLNSVINKSKKQMKCIYSNLNLNLNLIPE